MVQLFDAFVAEFPKLQEAWMSALALCIACLVAGWATGRFMYGQRIEDLKERIQNRDDRIRDFERKAGASPDEAAATIADLQKRLAALEPVTLTEEQCRSVVASVSVATSSVAILHDSASGGMTKKLHSQLATIFHRGGWQVRTPVVMGIGNPPVSGLAVIGPAGSREVQTIVEALRLAGVQFDLQPMPPRPAHNHPLPEEAKVEILVTTPTA